MPSGHVRAQIFLVKKNTMEIYLVINTINLQTYMLTTLGQLDRILQFRQTGWILETFNKCMFVSFNFDKHDYKYSSKIARYCIMQKHGRLSKSPSKDSWYLKWHG